MLPIYEEFSYIDPLLHGARPPLFHLFLGAHNFPSVLPICDIWSFDHPASRLRTQTWKHFLGIRNVLLFIANILTPCTYLFFRFFRGRFDDLASSSIDGNPTLPLIQHFLFRRWEKKCVTLRKFIFTLGTCSVWLCL